MKRRSRLSDAAVIGSLALLGGCSAAPPSARLRIRNAGGPVQGLVVFFPDDEIEFGDVAKGVTTEYRAAPHGVFGCAAWRMQVGGEERTQNVMCWVGEKPMDGKSFTYVIDFDASRTEYDRIRIQSVTRDD